MAVGHVMCSALCCACITLHGLKGMFGYVHFEGILITQKKEFHVKAAPGFRVNYLYSRITTFRREVLLGVLDRKECDFQQEVSCPVVE